MERIKNQKSFNLSLCMFSVCTVASFAYILDISNVTGMTCESTIEYFCKEVDRFDCFAL